MGEDDVECPLSGKMLTVKGENILTSSSGWSGKSILSVS